MGSKTNYVKGNTDMQKEILEVFRELPGTTVSEALELLPHLSRSSATSTIYRLYGNGLLVKAGKKRGDSGHSQSTFKVNPDPNPKPVSATRKIKLKKPTDAGLIYEVQELKRKISELEVWKANAIDRHPDLAVAPVVLRARKLAAAEVSAGGDALLAEQIRNGMKDSTLIMRVTIRALEEGE